jgi:hypothetical protein
MPGTQATYEDANLILRLYELRRDEKLREARSWFAQNFSATTFEDLQRIAPMGSQENAYVRMVVSYWEMAASFITAGVLNQDLFFQSTGELLVVWERLRELLPAFRQATKDPQAWANIEQVGTEYAKWMEAKSPEAYAAFQAMVRGIRKDG